jgi:hypothetical protein
MTSVRLLAGIGLLAAMLASTAGCEKQATDSPAKSSASEGSRADPLPLRTLRIAELTDAEKRYGHGPRPDPRVVYQPGLVIVEGGADAVRDLSSNGLGCSIDARAGGASGLREGSVVLVTSRCVGRVLAMRRQGDQLALILGPVEITEIIRDGFFQLDQPIDLEDTLVFEAADWPGASTESEPSLSDAAGAALRGRAIPVGRAGSESRLVRARYDQPAIGASPFAIVAVESEAPVARSQSWSNNRIIEAKIPISEAGVDFLGRAALHLSQPRLGFVLHIQSGRVTRCELEFYGAAGLFMGFQAGSKTGANLPGTPRDLPIDITIPIGGPVPFSILVRQSYSVQTVFTASNSYVSNYADYTFQGAFSLGYRDGSWRIGGPTQFKVARSPVATLKGASLGVTGLIFAHQVKVMVGVGAFGFATGPYIAFTSSTAVTRNSDAEGTPLGGSPLFHRPLAGCKQASLTMMLAAGVGYMIPKPITNAINSVLSALNIRHRVGSSGGLQTAPREILSKKGWDPDVPTCKLQ